MNSPKIVCRIHEQSLLAALAARRLRCRQAAVTLGNHIYLWNTDREAFLTNTRWLKHELCHIRQFRQHGFFRFLSLYLMESIKNGYYHNRFEKEARSAEQETAGMEGFLFLPR